MTYPLTLFFHKVIILASEIQDDVKRIYQEVKDSYPEDICFHVGFVEKEPSAFTLWNREGETNWDAMNDFLLKIKSYSPYVSNGIFQYTQVFEDHFDIGTASFNLWHDDKLYRSIIRIPNKQGDVSHVVP